MKSFSPTSREHLGACLRLFLVLIMLPPAACGDAGLSSGVVSHDLNSVASSNAVAAIESESAPVFEEQPVGVTFFGGILTTLNASVVGSSPLFLQWVHDGIPVPNATNDFLVIRITPDTMGEYRLWAWNDLGFTVSDPARIDLINNLLNVVQFDHAWRYRMDGVDLGADWREPGYEDESWSLGQGVFAQEGAILPVEVKTGLSLTNDQGLPIITYYFRTQFTVPPHAGPMDLVFTNLIHDGAVFYVDGEELYRVGMPDPPFVISHQTLATRSVNTVVPEFLLFPDVSLASGLHTLAMEVHQVAPFSPDVAMGTQVALLAGPDEPPQIIDHPQSLAATQGLAAVFTVNVFGSIPIVFQWFKDGVALAGGNQRSLAVDTTSFDSLGRYWVEVGNDFGSLRSEVASLTLDTNGNYRASLRRGPYLQNATQTNLVLRWQTDLPVPVDVRYGFDPDHLDQMVIGSDDARDHAVTLGNLKPGTRYYYAIHATGTNLTVGDDYHFTTLTEEPGPVRVWVLGDSGRANSVAVAVANAYRALAAAERDADIWLMLGDNAYNTGTDEEYQRAVFEIYPDLLRKLPLWSTIGNHETYSVDTNGHFAYFDIFTLPTQGEAGGVASGVENYYSFDYANVHFVCLDSEYSNLSTNGLMADWLRADLAAHTKDWLIAFWHSPPYTKGTHDSDLILDTGGHLVRMRENFLPILEEYGVDLVLAGHSHVYERSYLLDGHYGYSDSLTRQMIKDAGSGRPEDTGAYLKGAARGGAHQGAVYVVAGSSSGSTGVDPHHPAMWIGLGQSGSMVVDIEGLRMDVRFLRDTGAIDDHFTILKGEPPAHLHIATVRRDGDEWRIGWKSKPAHSYRLWSASDLGEPLWSVFTDWIPATGATTFWSYAVPSDNKQMFFAVEERVP